MLQRLDKACSGPTLRAGGRHSIARDSTRMEGSAR
jgi:hypothetical protein